MPQISPISWVIVVSFFLFVILLCKESSPHIGLLLSKKKSSMLKEKSIKW